MQAITTKFVGPHNSHGARIKAKCDAGSVTIPYPHELSGEECHRAALRALLKKLEWDVFPGYWIAGSLKGGTDYVYVYATRGLVESFK